MKILFILSLPVVLLLGCAHVIPQATSMNFSPESMVVVGPAMGESSETYLLSMIPSGGRHPSIVLATERAIKSVEADALVNTIVDNELGFGFLGLWSWQTIRVYGTAVRYRPTIIDHGMVGAETNNISDGVTNPATTDTTLKEGEISFFNDLKKGDILTIIFKRDEAGRKIGDDGQYEFLSISGVSCAMLKPVGRGFFTRKVWCSAVIGSVNRNK